MTLKKLPANDYPVFKFDVPSTGKVYNFRPFLVKETKALLIAQGTEDKENMLSTLRSVLQSACLDEEFNVNSLTIFDCEYLLLKLRSVSVGEIVSVLIKCDGVHESDESRECKVDINLANVEVANLDRSSCEIRVSDKSVVFLKYPPIDVLNLLVSKDTITPDDFIDIIVKCIDKIFINDEVYESDDLSPDDVRNWIETLPNAGYKKLVEFFDNLPYVRVKAEFICPKCGKHNVRFLTGLDVFF